MWRYLKYALLLLLMLPLRACRKDVVVFPPETVLVGDTIINAIRGFYLLNEGNMGSNKASLDYYDYGSATYMRNIYAFTNPEVVKDLGDVGNDLAIYGSRLYAVINVSNKIEVLTASNARRIGQIDIPNCRYLCFHDGYGYISSYAGPVSLSANHAQIGYVARFDTATLHITDTCYVGYQPDEICIVGNKLYVANSGGYLTPNYERTVYVIDLATFRVTDTIDVAPNLHRVRLDMHGGLWVSSRGDYYNTPSRLYYIDTEKNVVTDSVDIPVSELCIVGDSIYVLGGQYSYLSGETTTIFGIINIATHKLVSSSFITDGTSGSIRVPYGIAVNPVTHDVYVTDARNYVSPGYLHCYGPDGVRQWSVRTGDIPAHFALLWR